MMIERTLAPGRSGAGEIQRPQPIDRDRRADHLDEIRIVARGRIADLGGGRRDGDLLVGGRPQRSASGFPGSRLEAIRAGMRTRTSPAAIGFRIAPARHGLMRFNHVDEAGSARAAWCLYGLPEARQPVICPIAFLPTAPSEERSRWIPSKSTRSSALSCSP